MTVIVTETELSKAIVSPEPISALSNDSSALDLGDPVHTLAFLISGLEMAYARQLADAMGQSRIGNSTAWVFALMIIERNPGISPSDLAKLLVQDRSAVVRIVDNLETRDYVRRQRSSKDGRAQELFISSTGSNVVAEMRTRIEDHSVAFFDKISADELLCLTGVLGRVYDQRVLQWDIKSPRDGHPRSKTI